MDIPAPDSRRPSLSWWPHNLRKTIRIRRCAQSRAGTRIERCGMLLELKVAARGLRARPLFTLVAVATLAVGIGSNAAIFSVINAGLLPLPFQRSDRLVALYSRYLPASGYDFPYFALSGPEFEDLRSRVDVFSGVASYDFSFQNLTLPEGEAERILTMAVTAEFFDVLGVRPQQGRAFTGAEAQRREGCVAVHAEHGPLIARETRHFHRPSRRGDVRGVGRRHEHAGHAAFVVP
jgi:hypothetical protein